MSIEALGTLGEAGEALRQATHDTLPESFAQGEVDQIWLQRLVDKQTLGSVRKRFLAHLIDDSPSAERPNSARHDPDAVPGGGDIDLF